MDFRLSEGRCKLRCILRHRHTELLASLACPRVACVHSKKRESQHLRKHSRCISPRLHLHVHAHGLAGACSCPHNMRDRVRGHVHPTRPHRRITWRGGHWGRAGRPGSTAGPRGHSCARVRTKRIIHPDAPQGRTKVLCPGGGEEWKMRANYSRVLCSTRYTHYSVPE
jgi:hypothetical protein